MSNDKEAVELVLGSVNLLDLGNQLSKEISEKLVRDSENLLGLGDRLSKEIPRLEEFKEQFISATTQGELERVRQKYQKYLKEIYKLIDDKLI